MDADEMPQLNAKNLLKLLLLGAVLAPSAAQALTDGEDLLKWCTQSSAAGSGRCLGYLLAAEDALATDSIEGVRACLPRDIGLQQQHRIVVDWLRAHPTATAVTAMGLVARAYGQHFPCSR
jgi:hypothetical protein